MARDKSTQSAALSRLNSQLPLPAKLEYSDHVLDNSGSQHDLEEQVDALVLRLGRDASWTWLISWLLPPIGLLFGLWRLAWKSVKRRRRRGARPAVPDAGSIRLQGVEEDDEPEYSARRS